MAFPERPATNQPDPQFLEPRHMSSRMTGVSDDTDGENEDRDPAEEKLARTTVCSLPLAGYKSPQVRRNDHH